MRRHPALATRHGIRRRTDRVVAALQQVHPAGAVALVLLVMVAVWLVVAALGGPPLPLVHLYYVAIVLAAYRFGLRGAVPTAAGSGILAGPLAALPPTPFGEDTLGWAVRCAMFVSVGAVLSLALSARDRGSEQQVTDDVRTAFDRRDDRPPVDPELVARAPALVASGALTMVYQPIYSLRDGRLVAVEALARFDLPGRPGPQEVFAAAARAGCDRELELLAVRAALRGGTDLPAGVDLCVNVSPGTLADPRLHDLVVTARPRSVVVEVTEHAVIHDYDLLRDALARLADAEVRVAVDDAGSGFASLRHVVQLAPHIIKLDLSLAQGVTVSPLRRALGESLADFAHRSDALLVAEGVEDEHDLVTWAALGADLVQGYAVGRPGALPFAPTSDVVVRCLRRAGLPAR
ncbi:diguanylate phosphodiesterase [Actinotalea ferrariae CF5-4]|uniref:Diguanylate phosphodiesterase n=1 Tax=Actinotalea ferrariae CF5-4 TaxID=948458 RepID=A0A021VR32_9CELL|nr:EAL domain-containing protein [Actinotalea ferrariae]EYR63601.1 diguanylate phosphodiesterase [Actinotalea ferrariae CF5-4]